MEPGLPPPVFPVEPAVPWWVLAGEDEPGCGEDETGCGEDETGCPPPGDGDVEGIGLGGVGGAATTCVLAAAVTTVLTGCTCHTARITVADSVTVPPGLTGPGTWICARSRVNWPALTVPSAQVCVPVPSGQAVKAGWGSLDREGPDPAVICTVISAGAPPRCQTAIVYPAA
jgi:hypothetical protein